MSFTIGYDTNLGFPNDFLNTISCKLQAHHQLSELIENFQKKKLWAIFIPAGTLPYLSGGRVIAEAVNKQETSQSMQANFVSTKAFDLSDISTKTLARINPYCTTSFWALLLALKPLLPKHTVLQFTEVDSFFELLKQTALAKIDASMVWDLILKKYPDESIKVRTLLEQKNLPPPLLYAQTDESPEYRANINKIIQFDTKDSHFFFKGFRAPNQSLIDAFIKETSHAKNHFQLAFKSTL